MNDFFNQIGWDLKMMAAGFCGGVLHAIVFKADTFLQAFLSILAGSLTANYAGLYISKFFGTTEGFGGFIVGLTAIFICQGIIEAVKQIKLLNKPNSDNKK
jgi:hypothetical protein